MSSTYLKQALKAGQRPSKVSGPFPTIMDTSGMPTLLAFYLGTEIACAAGSPCLCRYQLNKLNQVVSL